VVSSPGAAIRSPPGAAPASARADQRHRTQVTGRESGPRSPPRHRPPRRVGNAPGRRQDDGKRCRGFSRYSDTSCGTTPCRASRNGTPRGRSPRPRGLSPRKGRRLSRPAPAATEQVARAHHEGANRRSTSCSGDISVRTPGMMATSLSSPCGFTSVHCSVTPNAPAANAYAAAFEQARGLGPRAMRRPVQPLAARVPSR
jgi:hypothetical protein